MSDSTDQSQTEPTLLDAINPPTPSMSDKPTFEEKTDTLVKAKKTAERIHLFEDKAFYTTIVFQSSEQLETFIKAMGWDKSSLNWQDGLKLAKLHKIKLPAVNTQTLNAAYGRRKIYDWDKVGLKFFDETSVSQKGGE